MIPNGWRLGLFSDGIELISGQHVEAKFVNSIGNGKPYLTGPADFPNGKIVVTKYTENAKKECYKGDLLITVKGSGTGKVIEADAAYAISRQLMAIRSISFEPKFCFYNLVASIRRYEEAAAGLIPGISREDVLNTPIMIPPKKEQSKIAKIISTWDKAINTTERLIDNSKQQKKALMQQLLTGKKRLLNNSGKAFENIWEEKRISELGDISSGGTPSTSKPEYWSGNIDWVTPTDITTQDSIYIESSARQISLDGIKNSSAKLLPKGALLVCTRATIGEMAIASHEMSTNQGFKNIVPNENTSMEYVYYLLSFFKHKLISKASGSTFLELSKSTFEGLKFLVPEYQEQQKIAAVLLNSDLEIDALKKQLADLKQEKKALMQQLLTGKRRVVTNDKEVA